MDGLSDIVIEVFPGAYIVHILYNLVSLDIKLRQVERKLFLFAQHAQLESMFEIVLEKTSHRMLE